MIPITYGEIAHNAGRNLPRHGIGQRREAEPQQRTPGGTSRPIQPSAAARRTARLENQSRSAQGPREPTRSMLFGITLGRANEVRVRPPR